MYAWWAYDEVKRRQDRAARAAERNGALRQYEIEPRVRGRRLRLRWGRPAQSLALRLSGGALFLIPRFAERDWKAA